MKLPKRNFKWIYGASFAFLMIYALRHVHMGVDLWDGGYNYANFRYMGLEYMDSMWYFATWLAGIAGNVLTRLPWGNTMLGMNVYTSLLTAGVCAAAYDFCVRKLRIPAWLAFTGEIVALSLCWAPSGALYNYLTYAFLLGGTLCLYRGLTEEKNRYLILAGAFLGLNVGVRFSNLLQAGLILAVWYYAFLSGKKFSEALKKTGFCMLGYFGAYGMLLLILALRYGPGRYWEGVLRLFAMTEHAKDYKAGSMLWNMAKAYYDATYWLKRYGVAVICGGVCCALLPVKWKRGKQIVAFAAVAGLLWWLLKLGYCYRDYKVYASVYEPCIVVFEFALLLSLLQMGSRGTDKNRKLLAALLVLTILLTSLGSNNAVYSSINNLFFVMPCFLGMVYEFIRNRKEAAWLPFQGALTVAALLLCFQAVLFGREYVYEEATGARDVGTPVSGIPVLQGMHTGRQKAEQLESLYRYIQEKELGQKECILYGNIPGIAYYMELAPAFNVWSDLRSYSPQIMERDLELLEREIAEGGEKPLVILERNCGIYADTKGAEGIFEEETAEQKMILINSFMERNGYQKDFSNEKYTVYR